MKRIASRSVLAALAAACVHGFWSVPALGNTWAIYVMNADGSEVQKIRYDRQAMFGSPCWGCQSGPARLAGALELLSELFTGAELLAF